jgi:hypothetical protein
MLTLLDSPDERAQARLRELLELVSLEAIEREIARAVSEGQS